MPWGEFCSYLAGISPDTVLGRIVQIRSETDKNILKHFTPEQKKIRSEWLSRKVKVVSEKDAKKALEILKQALISMAGGDRH